MARATQAALQAAASWLHSCEAPLQVRRSTIAVVGVLTLLGGRAMAMTNAPGTGIGLVAVGGLLLMTLVMYSALMDVARCLRSARSKRCMRVTPDVQAVLL